MEKIILPEGYEIDLDKSSNTEIVLKKMEEKKLFAFPEIISTNIGKNGNVTNEEIITLEKEREKITAISRLHILAEYYNRVHARGWKPDLNDLDQKKFHAIWMISNNTIVDASSFNFCSCNPVWASNDLLYLAYKHNPEIFHKALKP